jgi:hypothetical protein
MVKKEPGPAALRIKKIKAPALPSLQSAALFHQA